MSYSLSQLDAIGDVDPGGRGRCLPGVRPRPAGRGNPQGGDAQQPERLAIRTKLLEVYAKRRDTKGFELLATQLFSLTRGEGEDWTKAQETRPTDRSGQRALQAGWRPRGATREGAALTEPLGACTMPQSVLPSPSQFERAKAEMEAQQQHAEAVDSGSVDLDLDLDLATTIGRGARPDGLDPADARPRASPRA
jgi:pilus assembly protein FimV